MFKQRIVAALQRMTARLFEPLHRSIIFEMRRSARPHELSYRNPLNYFGKRYFSQNDEDGILLEILHRLEIGPSTFLELGVDDGTECNTIILLAIGWKGAWVGAEPLAFSPERNLSHLERWITAENAATLAAEALGRVGATIDQARVACVDLDGNDPHIVRTLLKNGLRPDVMIVEYNGKFPPGVRFEMPRNDDYRWAGGDFFGASLSSWVEILDGYTLIACNDNGVNAFFVLNEHKARFSDAPGDIRQIYRPGTSIPFEETGHRTSPLTVQALTGR